MHLNMGPPEWTTVHLVVIPGIEQIPCYAQATGPQSHDLADPERFGTTIHSLAITFKVWNKLNVAKLPMEPPAWPAVSKINTQLISLNPSLKHGAQY